MLVNHIDLVILKTIIYSRKYRYYKSSNKVIDKLFAILYGRKFYKFVSKYNVEIYGEIGKEIKIFHPNIVINKNAKIGDNVSMHGNICIGNNGIEDFAATIGNNADIGFGTTIIGKVNIANNIIIGANSVVTKSFNEENIIIAGNPAKKIKNR